MCLMSISGTIKSRKFITVVVIVVCAFFLLKFINSFLSSQRINSRGTVSYDSGSANYGSVSSVAPLMDIGGGFNKYYPEPVPSGESVNSNPGIPRKVLLETSLSLMVQDVPEALKLSKIKTEDLGGFVVNSNLNSPLESSNATLVIRVPNDKAAEMTEYLKGSAVKVVSENQNGTDITDQYMDIEERIRVINETKTRFEAIFNEAKTVEEMLNVQREILNLQTQLDSLTGQQKYLSDAAKTVKLTAYFSEDEYSLPYTPDDGFSLKTVFKQAVRSLMITLRALAGLFIVIVVYAVIWLPLLLIVFGIYKLITRHSNKKNKDTEPSKATNTQILA